MFYSSCSSTGKYSNPDKNRVTPLQRITPQRITPKNDAALAFKACTFTKSITMSTIFFMFHRYGIKSNISQI